MSSLERSPISHDQYAHPLQHTDGSESSSEYQPANSALGQRLIDDVSAASSPIPELTQSLKHETPVDPLVRRAVIRSGTIIYEVSRKSQIPNDWK